MVAELAVVVLVVAELGGGGTGGGGTGGGGTGGGGTGGGGTGGGTGATPLVTGQVVGQVGTAVGGVGTVSGLGSTLNGVPVVGTLGGGLVVNTGNAVTSVTDGLTHGLGTLGTDKDSLGLTVAGATHAVSDVGKGVSSVGTGLSTVLDNTLISQIPLVGASSAR